MLKWFFLALISSGFVLTMLTSGGAIYSGLLLSGVFFLFLALVLAAVLLIQRLRKKRRRALRLVTLGYAAAGIVLCITSTHLSSRSIQKRLDNMEINPPSIQVDLDFEVVDGTEPIELEPYYTDHKGDIARVYDSRYLSTIFSESGSADACRELIARSDTIEERFKPYFTDFVDRMERTYPEMDFTILYQNLKTLRVVECSQSEYVMHSLDSTSSGCYVTVENTIYIPEGTRYIEGEWGFQVLIHEFCHAARTYRRSVGSDTPSASFVPSKYYDTILEESMNSVFSCSLLSYYEKEISYRMPSNYLRVMLECMDNYQLSDYINHGADYFYKALDETGGYTNYAHTIWKLITLQREDSLSDRVDLPADRYYPIYDFLCGLYYPRHITADMTDEEARAVADELVGKTFYGAPENFKASPERFYEDLDAYRASLTEAPSAAA